MDIDERLERLTQRHEALTQSVELLTKDISELTKELSGMRVLVKILPKEPPGCCTWRRFAKSGSAGWKTRHNRKVKTVERTVFRARSWRRVMSSPPGGGTSDHRISGRKLTYSGSKTARVSVWK